MFFCSAVFILGQGLLLGGGRVLHKLKEELGGTLEYRRSQGVVCVHGQQGGPQKAAACVRTALLLRDESNEEPKVRERPDIRFRSRGG